MLSLISSFFIGLSSSLLNSLIFLLDIGWSGIAPSSLRPNLIWILLFLSSSLLTSNLIFWFDIGWILIDVSSLASKLTLLLLSFSLSIILWSSIYDLFSSSFLILNPNLISSLGSSW